MKKKFLALFLVVATALCGCGKSNGENAENQSQVESNYENETEMKEQGNIGKEEYEQPEMKGEITISTMIEQEFLKIAAEEFEKKYPDITITINTYQGASGEDAVNEYRTLLNTKIMSGKAEDIIFSTQLPVNKYMDMGVFEDLSDYISETPEINDENFFLNVLEAARDEDGQLFILPYMSSFQVISFDKAVATENNVNNENVDNIRFSKAAQSAKQMTDATQLKNVYLLQGKNINYIENLVKEHQETLIDMNEKKVNIDTEQYVGWLKEVKEMEQEGYFDSKNSIDYYSNEYYFAMVTDYDVQAAFYNIDDSYDV